jgi:hypothetical protein
MLKRLIPVVILALTLASPASARSHHRAGTMAVCHLWGIAHTYALPDAEVGGGELLTYVYRCAGGRIVEKVIPLP